MFCSTFVRFCFQYPRPPHCHSPKYKQARLEIINYRNMSHKTRSRSFRQGIRIWVPVCLWEPGNYPLSENCSTPPQIRTFLWISHQSDPKDSEVFSVSPLPLLEGPVFVMCGQMSRLRSIDLQVRTCHGRSCLLSISQQNFFFEWRNNLTSFLPLDWRSRIFRNAEKLERELIVVRRVLLWRPCRIKLVVMLFSLTWQITIENAIEVSFGAKEAVDEARQYKS